ncbi:MAG TPA: energy transducer TonB [Polyangia bacterium]|nr:energy transducer TonB [Polyangia bacterium]
MAFEAFRAESQPRPRRGRLTAALSIGFHGALLAAGVAYSFWHVDELTPPSVKVTFLSAAPPPPPPPPPAGGGGAARKKVVIKPKTLTKPTDIVQPRETPEEKPKESKPDPVDAPGERGGVKGGVIGGTIGGTVGGTIGGVIGGTKGGVVGGTVGGTGTARKFLPPGSTPPHAGPEPDFPVSLRRAGMAYAVRIKYCVAPGGSVDSVTLVKGADSLLDDNVLRAVKGWHFPPVLAGSTPIPWCTFALFNFKGE